MQDTFQACDDRNQLSTVCPEAPPSWGRLTPRPPNNCRHNGSCRPGLSGYSRSSRCVLRRSEQHQADVVGKIQLIGARRHKGGGSNLPVSSCPVWTCEFLRCGPLSSLRCSPLLSCSPSSGILHSESLWHCARVSYIMHGS